MAKAKDKEKKGSGKSKKASGAKLPKTVRKSGLMDLINSELGRELLADALIAAAGAAAAALTKTRPARQAGAAVADASSQAADATSTAAGAVATVVTEAARHFLPPSLVGGDDAGTSGRSEGKKVKYVHRASDHGASKKSNKTVKATKAEKADQADKL